MRKRIIEPVQIEQIQIEPNQTEANLKQNASIDQEWLNIEELVEVEITSEDTAHPIESALLPTLSPGWRAAGPGIQTIRLRFNNPQDLKRIRLNFVEKKSDRTHEYILRWSPDDGQSYREIVRQQWTFGSKKVSNQTEDYQVELAAVTVLELNITPDISGGDAVATLAQLRLA